ncbi:MAG: LptF/LptG family permease [Pseudomonadota bacterium]
MRTRYWPGTLSRYFIKTYVLHFLSLFMIFATLIFLITLIEIFRKTSGDINISLFDKLIVTTKQIPFIMEQIIALILLIAGLWTVTSLTYKSEMVVAKAAGFSLWRLGSVFGAIAASIGLCFLLVINPISTKWIKEYYQWNSTRDQATTFFHEKITYQKRDMIFIANQVNTRTGTFDDLRIYDLNQDATIKKVIFAEKAHYNKTNRELTAPIAHVTHIGDSDKVDIQTKLNDNFKLILPELGSFIKFQTKTDKLYSLYDYPRAISQAEKNNGDVTTLRGHFYQLLSLPIICALMAIIAVTAQPRSPRSMHIFKNVLLGLLSGFGFYVLDLVLVTFGKSGDLPFILAISLAKIIVFIGTIWVVLRREYG